MPATAKKSADADTTTGILEATAAMPLHLRTDRDSLAREPVSSRSLWGDKRWVFDNATNGSVDSQSAIKWDLKLPDGKNLLDPYHSDLLDWMRRLVWSVYAAPGQGSAAMQSGSLGKIGGGLRYLAVWLVARQLTWPCEINAEVIKAYQDDLQDDAEGSADKAPLTYGVAFSRLMPLSLLWRQRYALGRVGIAPMPDAPFGRAGVYKIAKKIAAVAVGSYSPLPDEVAIPVLNTAMTMLGTPAQDVIAMAETCVCAYAEGLTKTGVPARKKIIATNRQLAAAEAFRFTDINGQPWHPPLSPNDWEQSKIAVVERKLRTYLESRRAEWRRQSEGRPTLPTYRDLGRDMVDLRKVVLDLGLQPGDEQLLCRHPAIHALIDAAAIEMGCHPVPFIIVVQRVRQLVLAIRSAAHVVIQATTGMRVSEICSLKAGLDPVTGLPLSVQVQDSLSGLSEIFVLTSELSKNEDTPRAVPWVLGYRPKGSTDLPPAIQAMVILDRLLAPWRNILGINDLFVSFSSGSGIPKTPKGLSRASTARLREDLRDFITEWVDLTNLPDEATRKSKDKELVSYRESHGRIIKTHQIRKSFGHFASNIDRRLMPMLQMNFHHVSAAMTDGAYTGNPILERDLNDVRYQNLALELLEIARGNSGMAGRYAEQLEQKIVAELGARIADLSAENSYLEAFVYVKEAGIDRLFFEPYGICGALSASEMACHEAGGTADVARWEPYLYPNYETRQPSLCAGCACFAISRRHLSYWEMRYIDNAAQLRVFEELGRTGPLVDGANALTNAQAQQALAICRKLGSDMDELARRLSTKVSELLNAA